MEFSQLTENLTNPALLFFLLGIFAVQVKSDLKIPETSSKFIAIYLLLSIGFKGGQELSHSGINEEIIYSLLLGIMMAAAIPVLSFFLLKNRLSVENAGAIAASYGSVSAVTFVTAISFLDFQGIHYGGHMIAVKAGMEAPAIIVGVSLIHFFKGEKHQSLINFDAFRPYKEWYTNKCTFWLALFLFFFVVKSLTELGYVRFLRLE